MVRFTKMKWMICIHLVLCMLIAGCGTGSSRPEVLVHMDWSEFTLTNAEGKRLVLDFDKGEYPKGNMRHGEFRSVVGTPAVLYFDVPHSDCFVLEADGGRFDCSISAETYGGDVYGEDVDVLTISDGEVSMEGGTGARWISMEMPDLGWALRLKEETEGKTVMTRSGSTITITGVAGDYSLLVAQEGSSWCDPIEKTALSGTLTVDLSRLETEKIVTITDGDEVTEHKVKMP